MEGYLKRLQVPPKVGERAMEHYRMAEVAGVRGMTSTTLSLACIELACSQLGEPFDKKQAQRLSGQTQKAYLNCYQMLEKVLNVSSTVGIKELAVRFSCLEAEQLARDILESYKAHVDVKYTAAQIEGMHLEKSLYTVAALFTACKSLKIRCDKSKFQSAANSSRSIFQSVFDEMSLCAPKDIEDYKTKRKKKQPTTAPASNKDDSHKTEDVLSAVTAVKRSRRETVLSRIQSNPCSSDYAKWKEATLQEAKLKLL